MAQVYAGIAAHHAQLSALHQQFTQQQAQIHQRFLQMRADAQRSILGFAAQPSTTVEDRGATEGIAAITAPIFAPLRLTAQAPQDLVAQLQAREVQPPQRPVEPPRPAVAAAPAARIEATPTTSAPTATATGAPKAPAAMKAAASATGAVKAPGDGGAKQGGGVITRPDLGQGLPGLKLDRAGLEVHASGRISEIFGPLFERQDGFEVQVRMPEPPLLLATRLTGIDAVAGSMGRGTMWTETDVCWDNWYLHDGRMPAGIMIESGQADLMLISYLGVDFLNQGERAYRLLGCELTWHGGLPKPGETLCYDIHVDGHANQGDIRLFFFHYDCRVGGAPRLTVRQGQAGFFTKEELADSMGILWEPETGERCDKPRLDPPKLLTTRRRFERAHLESFAAGDVAGCFGQEFFAASAHTRTPRIQGGRMLFLDEVTDFDPSGGPWGRGYLRAVDAISPDDWFFKGHFKNDPCMPGTLMFEGCMQTMAFYMAGLGFTLDKDGWRFEPVPEETYKMRCRGQVTPSSRELIYEVFIEEVIGGPLPTIYADLLCTVDGLKAFHCRRMGLRLNPGWPMDSRPELLATTDDRGEVAEVAGFAFGYDSLLACAWGMPSTAFGKNYEAFDGPRNVPRLPGPPYHFISRVKKIDGEPWSMKPGVEVHMEYDVPPEAWYFMDNGAASMPFCVLLEAALQPCGWLASLSGSTLGDARDLSFRNLDGTGAMHAEVLPDAGVLRTRAKITSISRSAGMIIESFEVECFVGDTLVYDMKTVFGFFPAEALAAQKGLPIPEADKEAFSQSSPDVVDLRTGRGRCFEGGARLPERSLLMLDRVVDRQPTGGVAGLGRYRAEKDVNPGEWFFKAHFFQDPVQPGSLGIEAMVQALQFAMLDLGMDEGIEAPRFEALGVGTPMTWKYRGQVLLHNKVITTTLDITERGQDARGRYAIGRASLWVDGMRIYEATGVGMRIVSAASQDAAARDALDQDTAAQGAIGQDAARDAFGQDTAAQGAAGQDAAVKGDALHGAAPVKRAGAAFAPTRTLPVPARIFELDPARDAWLGDHRPTWTAPALPMMSMVSMMAAAAQREGRLVVGLRDVRVARWLPIEAPTSIRASLRGAVDTVRVTLEDEGGVIATGTVLTKMSWVAGPSPLPPLDAPEQPDPYAAGALFHGPAFQALRALRLGPTGASATLDADPGAIPTMLLNQRLLDAATHAIPHDDLRRWSAEIPEGVVAYPALITELHLHAPTPVEGEVRCEVRFDGFFGAKTLPAFKIQLIHRDQVWASLRLVEAIFPKGPIGRAPALDRLAFLRDRRFVHGVGLARRADDGATILDDADIASSDWLPGTVQAIYGSNNAEDIALKEHISIKSCVHPGALPEALPLSRFDLEAQRDEGRITVRDRSPERLDLTPVQRYWSATFGREAWPVADLYYGLIERFVRRVVTPDPAAFAGLKGRSCLFVANHQVGVESLLFSILASGLIEVPTVTLAKAEHRQSWLGQLIKHCFSYPDTRDPEVITFFDREDHASLQTIIAHLGAQMLGPGKAIMVHVEGTRALTCRKPVEKMSGAFVDMAMSINAPVVPVRFTGALPVEPLDARLEFPLGMGKQDIWIGAPLEASRLATLPYGERKRLVIDAINALGPDNAVEEPLPGDPAFAQAVAQQARQRALSHEHATLLQTLQGLDAPCDETRRLLDAFRAGRLKPAGHPSDVWLQGMLDLLSNKPS